MSKNEDGRSTTLTEIDSLIKELEQAQEKIEAHSRAPTVDLSSAIGHARRARDQIRQSPDSSGWKRRGQCVAYLLKVAKQIHSMIHCYLSQKSQHENWVDHKAA